MADYKKLYAVFLGRFLKPEAKIKVVFDCSNGSTGPVLKLLPRNRNVDYKLLNSIPNGEFLAHGPDPLKVSSRRDLMWEVKRTKADLGVIFDADGDRAIFVDNAGNTIEPDAVARLLIEHLKPKKVVAGTTTGWLVKTKKGYKVVDSPVGTLYLETKMRRSGADLGVEYSGHYYFKKFYSSASGILASIFVMNEVGKLKAKGESLSDWLSSLPIRYRLEEKNYRPRDIEKTLKTLIKTLQKKDGRMKLADGVTLTNPDFWVNIRASKTEPLLRLNIEAKTKPILKREFREIHRILRNK